MTARDPDIGNPSAPQNITYYLDPKGTEVSSHFTIDKDDGSLRIIEALDRDRPDGYPVWEMFVFARDSFVGDGGDSEVSLENFVKVRIELEDVNDNAPFLDMPEGLQWPENARPGRVGELVAEDYDEDSNGPPFKFSLDRDAGKELQKKFVVKVGAGGKYYLDTLVKFDREEQKVYTIPIRVEDNQGMAGTSFLTLVIGDKNDNPMAPGASSIFVYNYEGLAPDTAIGRVYVADPDDWDLPDKTFELLDPSSFPDFRVDGATGMVTMLSGIKLEAAAASTFAMSFLVSDPTHGQTGPRAVPANVTVTVQRIPEIAVTRSGSLRLNISAEEFVGRGEKLGRSRLATLLRSFLNATVVDVFTVLPSSATSCDVRWSAHGSPYYLPERMEVAVARRKVDIEKALGVPITMVHVSECLLEGAACEGSCYDELDTAALSTPTLVATNTSSFVGVTARSLAVCGCRARLAAPRDPCSSNPCLNGGSCRPAGRSYSCSCPDPVQYGPRCEMLAASYRRGWAAYPSLPSCTSTSLSFLLTTTARDGLLLYQGPSPNTVVVDQGRPVTDFMAIELQDGKLKYFLNLGAETWVGSLERELADNQEHSVLVRWSNTSVTLEIDDGSCHGAEIKHCQLVAEGPKGRNADFLNSNGPLQVHLATPSIPTLNLTTLPLPYTTVSLGAKITKFHPKYPK